MFAQLVSTIDSFLWGWPLIILLFGTHIFMTIRTGFIQKDIFKAIKMSVTADEDSEGDVSQFGALTTALSSTIGTGNIIGVGTAIAMGGPGSVFWMWMTGIFGIATKYAETLIGVKYRVKSENGTMIGGAMYALERGLNAKWAGILFSSLAALCAFGIGCTVQANAVVANITTNFKISPVIVAVVLSVIVALVIIGGIQSITKVSRMPYHPDHERGCTGTVDRSDRFFRVYSKGCRRRFRGKHDRDRMPLWFRPRTFLQ